MAEFKEVMKQAQRMCEYRRKRGLRCNDCDAVHICGLEIKHVGLDTLCTDADAVMLWAAENPEPQYPTWTEWLSKQGFVELKAGQFVKQTENEYVYECKTVAILTDKAAVPIPSEIAEKFGIKPKEGI